MTLPIVIVIHNNSKVDIVIKDDKSPCVYTEIENIF